MTSIIDQAHPHARKGILHLPGNAVIFVWRHNVGGELTDFWVILLAEIEGEICSAT